MPMYIGKAIDKGNLVTTNSHEKEASKAARNADKTTGSDIVLIRKSILPLESTGLRDVCHLITIWLYATKKATGSINK